MAEELEDYWKKPEPQANELGKPATNLGLWSRSRLLRIVVWVVTILIVLLLALVVSSFLSGFASPFEMLDWIRESLKL
jgi:hypothetical protein